MIIFTKEKILAFRTRQDVYKLVRNGKCLLDEFVKDIKEDKNLEPELSDLFANIEDVANGELLPYNRYKILKLGKLPFTAYEAKTKSLRLYLFHERNTGVILIIGGKKTEQDEDLERIKRIIKEYSSFK